MSASFGPCSKRSSHEICFKVFERVETSFEEVFHQDVPAHRYSQAACFQALRSLIIKFRKLDAHAVLWSYANGRRGGDSKWILGLHRTEYPTKGVIRQIVSGDVFGWFDCPIADEG